MCIPVESALLVSEYCQGVDLNCGCPQRWAIQAGRGGDGGGLVRAVLMSHHCLKSFIYPVSHQCYKAIGLGKGLDHFAVERPPVPMYVYCILMTEHKILAFCLV